MGAIIHNWLIGNMGTAGDYGYQAMHLYTVLAVVLTMMILLALALHWRRNDRASRKLLLAVAWFQLGFEILWRLVYLLIKGDSLLCWWPAYPCNLGGILLPLAAIGNWRTGKKLFYLFGFVGGCLTFAIPDGIFSTSVFVFPILKSVLQHTGLLILPMLELVRGSYRPSLKDLGWVILGCLIHLVNCEGIDRLLGLTGDYMFLRSGLPFVIPGVPQWITISIFALIVLTVLLFLCDVKGSLAFLKNSRLGRKMFTKN